MSSLPFRIGFGYDSHGVDSSRPLVLGGVTFDDCPGLKGHSDADVLTHAIIDAILSAAGQGDIGEKFPDTDPRYRNISSMELLRQALPAGWLIAQVDATVVCDRPKILPNRERIIGSLRSVLGPEPAISVKGKTTEGLGALGRGEGIVAFAVALLSRA
ncbi:MAG: 2-C-methyl-D-erythritol 2,4-cyclodiphosphate synthase [Candidatus Hydrogenedentota bacterium]